ncbi:MAG: SWIM zinc finger family protein [Candidatus Krumholzibacteriia bacterium]
MSWRPPRRTISLPQIHRRLQALEDLERLGRGDRPLNPVSASGRTLATTFWGRAWCDNLERYSDFHNRLPRARTYLRTGAVIDLQVEPGLVTALVSGTDIYRVDVEIEPVSRAKWRSILRDCGGAVDSMVELLQGNLSGAVMDRICGDKGGLFPSSREISCRCTCPDWATMCKHVAAALYGVGVRLDDEPGLLFKLRGVDPAELIAHAEAKLVHETGTSGSERLLTGTDLSELFGVDILTVECGVDPAVDRAPAGMPAATPPPAPTADNARLRDLESRRRALTARIAVVSARIERQEARMALILERGLARRR